MQDLNPMRLKRREYNNYIQLTALHSAVDASVFPLVRTPNIPGVNRGNGLREVRTMPALVCWVFRINEEDKIGVESRLRVTHDPFVIFYSWPACSCTPGAHPDRRVDLCRLRWLQRLAAYAARRREWHVLLAVHARADRRNSRAAGEVPADAFHGLSDCSAGLPGALYLRGYVPG